MVTRQEVVDVYIFKPDKPPSRPKRGYVPGDPTVKDVSIIAPKPERRADVLAAYLNRTIAFSFSSDDIKNRKRVQSKRDAEVATSGGPAKAPHRPTMRHGLQPAEYNQLAKRYAEAVAGSIGSSDFSWSNHDQSKGGSSRSRSTPHTSKAGVDRMPPSATDAAHLGMGTSAAVLNAATSSSDPAAQERAACAAPAPGCAEKRSRDDGEQPGNDASSAAEPTAKRRA
ncbi:hypothetical protein FNF28_03262 [Cafeteria roenbergensis]|uniref:Uncharacterized protein n=1 Tax=Cafeteria roenbergensis TaxID=33653 RepID=A0A5A8DN12_CAFRO|nr:hypothetical protein FNF28_03262 [Cafeteria roenbergensis]